MARWQLSASTVTIVPCNDSIASNFGTAGVSSDLASVAICARTRRGSQPQALTMCNADLPLARSKERRSVDRHHPLNGAGKLRHEPLKGRAEPLRIEQPEQTTEGVVAGQAILKLQKAAQEPFFRPGEAGHVHGTLAAAQHRAERNHQ